jgi:hypothetical protein
MGKAICESHGALDFTNSIFLNIYTPSLFKGVSTVMPYVALLCSEAAVGKQVPQRHKPRTPASGV